MRYVSRTLETTLARAARTFPAVLVTGPRQSGKTTLLRHVFGRTHAYVSLERPDVRARAISDPVAFFQDNPPPVILDEIQRAPELLHYAKDAIDEDRRAGRWVFTGSQGLSLLDGISQTLAGRVAVLHLDPMTLGEVRRRPAQATMARVLAGVFGGTASPGRAREPTTPRIKLGDWLMRGGFPEVRLDPRVDRALWLSSYVQTYLERDVRDVLRVGDLEAFGRFLRLVAARTGTLLNMTDLGRDAGITGPTAKSWLSVLEASHLVYLLRPHFRNLGKRLVKSPKIYVTDPGLATYLMGLHTAEAALHGPSAEALVETAIVSEWVKLFRQRGETPPLYFFRSSAGDEVDLVVEYDGRTYGVEIKATATPRPEHAESLARWMDATGSDARGVLACQVDAPTALRPGVRAVPWSPEA